MNNNRNNNNANNRRRGRGNNNRPQGGGRGEQLNRIDSRARGNAPQLLEKYRKLASDAHLNGDRVSAEYYLQFADHYFRVIADARLRQEEQRQRRDDRFDGGADEGDEGDYGADNDFPTFDQPAFRRDEPREPQTFRGEPRRAQQPEPAEADDGERAVRSEGDAPASEPAAEAEPAGGNPFTRNNRSMRGLRPRGENRGENRGERGPGLPAGIEAGVEGEPGLPGLDPAALPPAITEARDAAVASGEIPAPAPAPRRRTRRPRPAAEDAGGDSLEAVGG